MEEDNRWKQSVYETYVNQQEQKDHFLNQLANVIEEAINEDKERKSNA